ncbi:hypothetical protein ACFSUD_17235 [Sulfitobacter aestuarii]|uniref:Uncharacterized protein n=1 Tax=Sulfitobacter aestuarii TaxID=2161676 RepID=A0ABW5U7A7_9RHOB
MNNDEMHGKAIRLVESLRATIEQELSAEVLAKMESDVGELGTLIGELQAGLAA